MAPSSAEPIPLIGWEFTHQFSDQWTGETPTQGWQPVRVPSTLDGQGLIFTQYGFYRVQIDAEQLRSLKEPTVLLGQILEADRSYFNGELIGARGDFGPGFDTVTSYRKQRLYRIPRSLIDAHENQLNVQIRVWNTYGGMVGPAPVLGEYQALAEIAYQREYWHSLIDVVMVVLSACALLVSLWLYFTKEVNSPELFWLSLIMLSLFFINMAESLPVYNLGLKSGPLQLLAFTLTCILVVPIAHYYHHLQLSIRTSWHNWRDCAIALAGIIYILSFVELLPTFAGLAAGTIWLISIITLLLNLFFNSLRAAHYKVDGAALHFFALLCLIIFSIVLTGVYPVNVARYRTDQIGMALFIVLIMLGYLKRNSALHKRHRQLTSDVFALRNDEQQRISRDLHDGFGQQLAVLKLQLNMLSDNADPELIEQAKESLNRGLKQLKEIALGLNPVSVNQHGLAWSIENEVASLSGLHQIEVDLDLQKTDLDNNTKLHLFRIFQECLNNAIKHSDADKIEISLLKVKQLVVMKIKDNGIGYNAASLPSNQDGLGLINLRERAELIDANLSINTSHATGTVIQVTAERIKTGKH